MSIEERAGATSKRCPVTDFDIYAARTYEESNEQWRQLRERCPVAWSEHHGGHWLVARYADVAAASRAWEVFANGRGVQVELSSLTIPRVPLGMLNPVELDPPLWQQYRRILSGLLSPNAAKRMQPSVAKWTTHFLDQVVESGKFDIASDLTSSVPGAVVLEFLGFPREDWRRMSHAFHELAGNPTNSREFVHAREELKWMDERIEAEVADRQRNPRGDAISTVVTVEIDGKPMPTDMAQSMVRQVIAGGVDTTTSVTTSALVHLHFHLEHRQALLDDPGLLDSAVEEFLRVYPPVRGVARTVTQDVELGGSLLLAGDRVWLGELSACHDQDAFPDADRFIIDRLPNHHVAFGVGIHRCPGSHLARIEIREILSQVLGRIPDFRVIEEGLVPYPSWAAIGGWAKAPAVFTPVAGADDRHREAPPGGSPDPVRPGLRQAGSGRRTK
jgi:cytochrome P450